MRAKTDWPCDDCCRILYVETEVTQECCPCGGDEDCGCSCDPRSGHTWHAAHEDRAACECGAVYQVDAGGGDAVLLRLENDDGQ